MKKKEGLIKQELVIGNTGKTAKVVVAITSRALFDLKNENDIFNEKGSDAYYKYQIENEGKPLGPGPGYALVKELLALNETYKKQHLKNSERNSERLIEVVIVSKNSPEAGIRIFNSIEKHKLDITRGAFLGGAPAANFLKCFNADLFLSMQDEDVTEAHQYGIAAGLLHDMRNLGLTGSEGEVRIALDVDKVIVSGASEEVFDKKGPKAFHDNEVRKAKKELEEGPFGKFVKTMSRLKEEFNGPKCPIKLYIVTARNAPAHERVIRTLRKWSVNVDQMFFLGGVNKNNFLKEIKPHIFFDDKQENIDSSKNYTPSAKVPWKKLEKKSSEKK